MSAWSPTTPYVKATPVGSTSAVPPPPPADNKETTDYSQLPAGWSTAVNPQDGRIYYFEQATGRTSWCHPLAPSVVNDNDKKRSMEPIMLPHQENPLYASRKPDTHECNSFAALLCCPIIGLISLYHSMSVNRKWEEGKYGDAVTHARQAPQYATLAICVGICFWIWFFLFRGERKWEWPDWDLGG